MKLLTIQNIKNGKKIQVTDEQWNVIKGKKWDDRYKIIDTTDVTHAENIPAILAKANGNKVTVDDGSAVTAKSLDVEKGNSKKVSGAPIPEKLPNSSELEADQSVKKD